MPQKVEGVTIAFLGTGAMDVDAATDLIEEYIEATIASDDAPVRFVFPLTTDEFSDTLGELVEMAKQSDISYEVITHNGDKGSRLFTDIASSATKTYHVADVFTQIEQILTEAPTAVLEVLWDTEREEEMSEILGRFLDAAIDVRDLTNGNSPVEADEENVATTEEIEEGIAAAVGAGLESKESAEEVMAQDAEVIYSRADLEALNRADIKEIAVKLGLPPRRSSAAMIEEILEAQSGFESEEETTQAEQPVDIEVIIPQEVELTTGSLVEAIEGFPSRLHDVLDQFLTDLAKTIEGVIFNTTPEVPAEPPAPTRRLRAR